MAVDGSGSNPQVCAHSTNSCSTLLSTSHPNDVIIVFTTEALDLQTVCTFSVTDSARLSWTLRASVSGRNDGTTGTNRDQVAEFWATSSVPLAFDNITESISGCASIQYGGEYNGLLAFGVSGANFNMPFDPNLSVPATASSFSNTPAVRVSTSDPKDMIIGAALQSSFPNLTAGPGFTLINSGAGFSITEYSVTNGRVRNFSVSASDTATWYWEIIGDAIQSN